MPTPRGQQEEKGEELLVISNTPAAAQTHNQTSSSQVPASCKAQLTRILA